MNGCVVEVHGVGDSNVDGLRGVVVESATEQVTTAKRHVCLDTGTHAVFETKNLCAVFCVGLPCECRARVYSAETPLEAKVAFAKALDDVDANKFWVLFLGVSSDSWWEFAKIPIGIVSNVVAAAAASDREPLVRFYLSSYSQDEPGAKIRFGTSLQEPAPAPSHADLSSEYMMHLVAELQHPLKTTERNYRMELERVAES